MPGTPPTSPNFGAPRYADSDTMSFSEQVNAITDTVDAKAVLTTDSRLSDERVPEDGSVTTAKIASGGLTLAALAEAVANVIPKAGDLVQSAASTRAGYVLCDGTAYSRSTYAALFAAIGTNFGPGDGETTFNVPDYRGRVIIGAGSGTDLSPRTLGQYGGEETHQLTAAESGVNGNGYAASSFNAFVEYTGAPADVDGYIGESPLEWGVNVSSATGASLAARNADNAHNNMQPYGVANTFICTGL
jgi:microcystin-dependent protein